MGFSDTIPDREQDTRFLGTVLIRGLQSAVANLFGCVQQTISQQVDPNCPTHSWFAQYKRFQWSLDGCNLEQGDKLWNNLSEDRRRWREAIVRQRRDDGGLDLDKLTGDIGTEFVEFVQCRLAGKPTEVQLRECEDIIRVARLTRDQYKREMKASNVEKITGRKSAAR